MSTASPSITPDDAAEIERLKSAMLKKSYFVMFRKILAPEKLGAVMLDHYRWIIDLEKRNLVFASGPLFQQDGAQGVGMTIFKAKDWEEATRLAASDPFCTSGAAQFDIARWQINEGRICVSVDFSDRTYTME
jgi:uncharacterized protein